MSADAQHVVSVPDWWRELAERSTSGAIPEWWIKNDVRELRLSAVERAYVDMDNTGLTDGATYAVHDAGWRLVTYGAQQHRFIMVWPAAFRGQACEADGQVIGRIRHVWTETAD